MDDLEKSLLVPAVILVVTVIGIFSIASYLVYAAWGIWALFAFLGSTPAISFFINYFRR